MVFTDGSSRGNGRKTASASFACVFPNCRAWDLAAPLAGDSTNNRAEYAAALAAICIANEQDPARKRQLQIYTDSQLLYNSMTRLVKSWAANDWRTSKGHQVKNQELLRRILQCAGNRPLQWHWVNGHSKKGDYNAHWNDEVNALAQNASEQGSTRGNVPNECKELVKATALASTLWVQAQTGLRRCGTCKAMVDGDIYTHICHRHTQQPSAQRRAAPSEQGPPPPQPPPPPPPQPPARQSETEARQPAQPRAPPAPAAPPPMPPEEHIQDEDSLQTLLKLAKHGPLSRKFSAGLLPHAKAKAKEYFNKVYAASLNIRTDQDKFVREVTNLLRLPTVLLDAGKTTLQERSQRLAAMLTENLESLNDEIAEADSQQQAEEQPSQPTPEQAEDAADSKACSQANHIIREGAPHAHQQAAKILKSQGLVDVQKQPEVVELVRGIFPQVEQQMPRTPPNAKDVDIGDTLELQMLKQLRRMRGKAPGPSGWTADALSQLVDDLDVRQGLLALVGAIMNNIVPPDLRCLLVARDLCLVPKEPVPRPIAKGDVFVKLASRIAYQRVSLKVKKYLTTRNVSLGLSGGCEFVVHMLNATLKHNDNAATKSDKEVHQHPIEHY